MTEVPFDFWASASEADWQSHVVQSVSMGLVLTEDSDHTFYVSVSELSSVYVKLHDERRLDEPRDPNSEWAIEDYMWGQQRAEAVTDCIVGSACVVLMRWMELVKRVAIGEFMLLSEPFPVVESDEKERSNREKALHRNLMKSYGTKFVAANKQVQVGAEAVWQIGNCFKHANGGQQLHPATRKVVSRLGFRPFAGPMQGEPEEARLRQLALAEVGATLGGDSIDRMAIQLGCNPKEGLMPLYEHVSSWQSEINEKLRAMAQALE